MKREGKLSRRLRMHIALLASEGYSATKITCVLYCFRTTVYTIVGRFVREGPATFDDRKRRGLAPFVHSSLFTQCRRSSLLGRSAARSYTS